jgi:hypothetical protein
LILAFCIATPALADQYQFTIDHCSAGCGTAPFGTIDVTQNGANTVNIAVNLTSGDKFVSTGFPGSFAFDIIGNPTITVSNLTSGWSLVSPTAGNLHFDGFGNLDYALSCNICGNGGSHPFSGPISFDVTAAGLDTADFKDLSRLPPGSAQAYFVADILGSTGNTGPVGATLSPTQTSATPEPSSLLLLGVGAGLLGLSCFRRRRKA